MVCFLISFSKLILCKLILQKLNTFCFKWLAGKVILICLLRQKNEVEIKMEHDRTVEEIRQFLNLAFIYEA